MLHEYGTPAHRLEDSLARVAEAFGLRSAQFLSTPTAMHLAMGNGARQRVYLRRSSTERLDLDGLARLDAIVEGVLAGRLDAARTERLLRRMRRRRPIAGPRAQRWASATASATAAVLLGGGMGDVLVAAVLGLGVGWLGQATALRPRTRTLYEPLTALAASAVVTLLASLWPAVSEGTVLVSALIMLVPGLTLTIAMTELAAGHWVSGTARLSGAMTLMFTMLFGAALGRQLALTVPLLPWIHTPNPALPEGTWLVAIAAAAVAFTVLLGARARDAGWIGLSGAVSTVAAQAGATALGPELGAFVGALAMGLASNAFARRMRRPATIMRLPGLLLLVPGSLGFRSLGSLLAADTVAGTDGMFRVAMVAVALATGLFAADLLLPSRRGL